MVEIEFGDGKNTLFWHMPWLEQKPIIFKEEFVNVQIRRDFLAATVREVAVGEWNSVLRGVPEGIRILDIVLDIQCL